MHKIQQATLIDEHDIITHTEVHSQPTLPYTNSALMTIRHRLPYTARDSQLNPDNAQKIDHGQPQHQR
jgi:hypothetical protein